MKFIDMFSGIGGFRTAMENNGHECIAYSEIDKYAKKSYQAMYDTENEIDLGDITNISQEYLSRFKKDNDMVVGGSPCFRKGTLITTKNGLKPIEEIKKGDYVLTHNNRYKEVVVPMVNPAKEIYSLKVMNSVETYVTPEHPVRAIEKFSKYNSKERKYDISFSKPKWIKVKDLQKGKHYIQLGKSSEETNPDNITKEEAWLIGRYIADGYLLTSKRSGRKNSFRRDVVFCVGKDKKLKFENKLSEYTMNPSEEKTVYKYRKQNERLFNLVSKCGRGSENKEIPQEYLSLPSEILEELIEGYLSGDGSCSNGVYSFTTVSEKLALSLVSGLNNVYKNGASITFSERPKKHIIEGREVNQKDTYRIQLRKKYNKGREPQTLKIDNFLYAPIKKIEIQETSETVYNFEVEDDNSYVANNMVVHNCQSFSLAGSRKGFEDTRGTLFFEYAKVVKETQPKYFLFENVKGMMSHDKGNTIRVVLETFNELGYYIDFNVFNSKYYDVPQNRERIYILGKRKDLVEQPKYHDKTKEKKKFDEIHNWAVDNINYIELLPPLQTEVTTRLIDVLEDEVDEKYYLSEEKTKKLTLDFTLTSQDRHGIAIREATKQGYAIAEQGDSVNVSYPTSKTRRGRVGKQVAQTLQAGEVNQGVVMGGDFDDKEIERNTLEILQTLQKEIGEKEIAEWRSRIFDTFQQEEILRQNVYEKRLDIEQDEKKFERKEQSCECEVKNRTFDKQERMRKMPINKEFRCSSHGRESIQQFAKELTSVMQELSHETSQEKNLYRLRETTQGIRLLRKALSEIQEIWRPSLYEEQSLRIRKLVPIETWRLQGFTDEQFYKAKDSGVSNSQLYKQSGNSVTVNVVDAIVKCL